jgi:tetratricopeptide (TPR) repeat protein
MESKQNRESVFVCLFLVVATLAVYLQVGWFEFVNYDDINYVTYNSRIKQGFSIEFLKWAFTANYASNWHPLTWMSHALDWSLFGSNAGGHHLTNVLFHIAGTLVLFFALRSLTASVWRSGVVAALFALHPLHVESVAWVSERKDVLSGFFWMCTVLFYSRYVKERIREVTYVTTKGRWNYFLAVLCFGFGMLAKQMLVTLPFALMLLDIWPLRRLQSFDLRQLSRLALEKLPFFLVTGIIIPVAIWAQQSGEAVVSVSQIPFDQRIENCLISYLRYFLKLIWPAKMTVFYPYPDIWPAWLFAAAAAFVVAASGLAIWQVKRRPFIFVGWFWFVGTLIPVIGLMQIGSQSMADRYSYIPFVGLFIVIVWAGHEIFSKTQFFRRVGVVLTCVALLGVLPLTGRQISHWKNSLALFEHGLSVTEKNPKMHTNLGSTLLSKGQTNAAIEQFEAALKISPHDPLAHGNLAEICVDRKQWEDASRHYETALKMNPRNFALHDCLGTALVKQNQYQEAIGHFRTALDLSPDNSDIAFSLGKSLLHENRLQEAIVVLERLKILEPRDPVVLNTLGNALLALGRFEEAEICVREAIDLRPAFAEAHQSLGLILMKVNQANPEQHLEEAASHFHEALRYQTNNALAHLQLATIAAGRQDLSNAISEYRAALKINPEWPEALNNLAWLLATSGDAKLRNGEEAVQLAEKACQLIGFKTPVFVGTLAAAYAEAGNFPKAIEMGEAAYQIANSTGQNEIAEKNQELLKLYRAGHPFWEPLKNK